MRLGCMCMPRGPYAPDCPMAIMLIWPLCITYALITGYGGLDIYFQFQGVEPLWVALWQWYWVSHQWSLTDRVSRSVTDTVTVTTTVPVRLRADEYEYDTFLAQKKFVFEREKYTWKHKAHFYIICSTSFLYCLHCKYFQYTTWQCSLILFLRSKQIPLSFQLPQHKPSWAQPFWQVIQVPDGTTFDR